MSNIKHDMDLVIAATQNDNPSAEALCEAAEFELDGALQYLDEVQSHLGFAMELFDEANDKDPEGMPPGWEASYQLAVDMLGFHNLHQRLTNKNNEKENNNAEGK